jgi:hypothetical protein
MLNVTRYHHRQNNPVTLLIFAAIAAVAIGGWMLFAAKLPIFILIVPLVLAGIAVPIFATMTTDVTDSEFIVAFGLGVMRRRVTLADIVRAEPTTTPWWYGIGININPTYVTYTIASGPAVAITLRKGMALRITTNDAAGLLAALAKP